VLATRTWRRDLNQPSHERPSRRNERTYRASQKVEDDATPRSLPEIGRFVGKRDHTTVIHGIRTIEELLKDDFILQRQLEQLELLIMAECSILKAAKTLEEAVEIIKSEQTT
jgi:chromosomal replication initiator protein